MDTLLIVIPAYNEEENIEQVAYEWHEVVTHINKESRVIIIDDGSKDNTFAKLQKAKDELSQLEIIHKSNSGHGATVYYGYRLAVDKGADYVFQTDSDGQTIPSEFWQFWEARREYDLQIGHRKGRQDGLSRVFVTKILKLVIFLQFGMWITDANTPFRLMSAESLSRLLPSIPEDSRLTNVLLSVLYQKHEQNIRCRPITFRPRQGGVNSINLKRIAGIGRQALKDFAAFKKAAF